MNDANREALRKVLSAVQRSNVLFKSYCGSPRSTTNRAPECAIPSLQLSYPNDVLLALQARRLPTHIVDALTKKINDCTLEVQRLHQTNFKHTCDKLIKDAPATTTTALLRKLATEYERLYQAQYVSWLGSMISQYLSRTYEADKDKKRPMFNAKYTPVLEKYFQQNAYPSAAERRILAQKSGMSPRQIEVWFQNHRNRSKKEGCTLPRRHSGSPRVSLENIERDVLGCASPDLTDEELSDDEQSVDEEASPSMSELNPLDTPAPSHAFPTPYRPSRTDDTFPSFKGRCLPAVQWPRRSTARSAVNSIVDVDDLAQTFASKLSLRDTGIKIPRQKQMRAGSSEQPWFHSTVTVLPSAPLPSLVRTSSTLLYTQFSSVSHAPRASITPARRSQKARLPKRLPSWSSKTPLSKGLSSRTSSLGSISSCDSSSFGSVVDELATPPHTPLSEPVVMFGDLLEDSLSFEFYPDFSSPPMPFGLDTSHKTQGGFPPMFPSFQYVTSS